MGIHLNGNEEENNLIAELREQGHTVYSISRLNSFNQCQFSYYNTYIKRNRGLDSVYGVLGSAVHEYLENAYREKLDDTSDFTRKLNSAVFKAELADLKFPSENVEKSWMADMTHFTNNFKRLDGEFELEKAYVAKFGEHYMMGYIDVIRQLEDGTVEIHDFKTSSKFGNPSKLQHAGRQLIVYKLALEQKGMKIDKLYWNMLKYCYVSWKLKNGKVKQKMVNRGKLIKDMTKEFEKTMLESGMDDITVTMTLGDALKHNNFDMLPQCIKDKYTVEDCLLEYEATEERIQETLDYIESTINAIESKNPDNEEEWKPLDIDKENFYCNTLCGLRAECKFLKQYKRDNPFKKIGF